MKLWRKKFEKQKDMKKGHKGQDVLAMQALINAIIGTTMTTDGDFGRGTELCVKKFQQRASLPVTGVADRATLEKMGAMFSASVQYPNRPTVALGWSPVDFAVIVANSQKSYGRSSMRSDIAKDLEAVIASLRDMGVDVYTSGAYRGLKSQSGSGRVPTSFHLIGRAVDLFIHAGMIAPQTDYYVLERTTARTYTVWGRSTSKDVPEIEIKNCVSYSNRIEGETVKGRFVNVTKAFAEHGFVPIRSRSSFESNSRSSMMGAEWWHFQSHKGLTEGRSTFGEELLKLYAIATIKKFRGVATVMNKIFKGKSFR